MKAAIYARKSTDQSDVHEGEKSVAHQRERCLALIESKGWAAHAETFTDDNVSGALFGESRPELARLLVQLKAKRFDVVVTYDNSRLGRDVIETGYLTKQILDSGVRLFFADGSERKLDSATDALLLSITSFGGQFEREQASIRVKSKMHAKASEGHVTGTVPFGYTSVAVNSHKELAPDPEQSKIVRRIFELSGEGNGITRIAHLLRVEYPGLRQWSPAGVRDLLANEVYIGRIVYGRSSLVIKQGKKVRVKNPKSAWVTKDVHELAIIPAPLWAKVQARKSEQTAIYLRGAKGKLNGKPDGPQHLLAGFCVCSECGGRLVVWSASGKRANYRYLVCWRHRSGGNAACSNSRSVPLGPLTDAIVKHFTQDVLTPETLAATQKAIAADAEGSPEQVAARKAELLAEVKKLEARVERLVDAIADGGDSKALAAGLVKAEHEVTAAKDRVRQLGATQAAVAQWTEEGANEKITALLGDVRAGLEGAPVVGRQILRKLLTGTIKVTSWVDSETGQVAHSYEAQGSYGKALAGALGEGWNVHLGQDGQGQADVQAELKALLQSIRNTYGPGGRTS